MKRNFIFFAFLCVFIASTAQELKVGITGGMNLNSVTGNENRIGYTFGLKGEYFFIDNKGFYMDLGLQLANKSWKSSNYYDAQTNTVSVWKANPHFVNIPIHIGYMLPVSKNVSLFANAGPYVAVGVFGKYKSSTDSKESLVANNIFDDYLKRFDYGIGGNIGVRFGRHIELSVGYNWGLNNLKTRKNPLDYKNRSLEVSCSYLF